MAKELRKDHFLFTGMQDGTLLALESNQFAGLSSRLDFAFDMVRCPVQLCLSHAEFL